MAKHCCHIVLCSLCYQQVPQNGYKTHNCLLKTGGSHQTIFNRKCFFDIETCFDPTSMDSFKPVLVVLEFETACFGNMSRIAFGDSKMKSQDLGVAEPDIAQNDYCAPYLPNLLAPNKLNARFKSRARCWPRFAQEVEPWNQRVGLTSEEV